MLVADITEITNRFQRALMLVDSWGASIGTTPKKRSFNSDAEIQTIILEADELLAMDIRQTVGHPWAPNFFTLSDALVHGDAVPASDAPVHKVTWSATELGAYAISEEGNENDIIQAVKDYTLFGAAAADTYGYHKITPAGIILTTSPFVKVTQAEWFRSSVCQCPQSFTTGILLTAIGLAYKDSLDVPLVSYADRKSDSFRMLIRQGAIELPQISDGEMEQAASR
jgi:hypothetical protein